MKNKLKNLKDRLIKNRRKGIAALSVICVLAFAFWYGGNGPGLRGWTAPAPLLSISAETSDSTAAGTPEVSARPSSPEDPPPTPSGATTASETTAPSQKSGTSSEPKSSAYQPPSADEKPAEAGPEKGSEPKTSAYQPLFADEKPAEVGPEKGSEPEASAYQPPPAGEKSAEAGPEKDGESSGGFGNGSADYSKQHGMVIDPETGKDQYRTDPVPEGRPVPVEPENAAVTDKTETCMLSVRCDTILNNMELLSKDKWELVPKDGIIFAMTAVPFCEGESVFNVLRREMKKAGIQMEFKNTPMYNSAYIEGIDNLYEFDAGELSGWMYKVNGWFPNYGCSRYQLKKGDVVEWVYTCTLGKDVGGCYATGGS